MSTDPRTGEALACGHPASDRLENDGCATCHLHDSIAWRDQELVVLREVELRARMLMMLAGEDGIEELEPTERRAIRDLKKALAAVSSSSNGESK